LGDFLITFPNAENWELPHDPPGRDVWHSDELPWPSLIGFVFLNDVGRQGGGTLVVRGSHRLPRSNYREVAESDGAGRKWKHRWELDHECDWLRALRSPGDPDARYQQFVEQATEVNGVHLKVVELTGEAGDVVLCHPWLIHAIAPNAAATPRFMRTPRVFGTGQR
jgi:ectoine hydroxylase-related dioxygenase (phytanoyl-CoA dioxygenase family)